MERLSTREKLFAATLSGLAGYVDAVGFVQSKGFFVSFMSGNSTRLGVGLAESLNDALAAAGLIAAFMVGVTGGSIVGWVAGRKRVFAVLSAVAVLLASAAALGATGQLHSALAFTAFAMGAENATMEHNGQVRVGLTYMTGSVVKLGQALAYKLTNAGQVDWLPPTILWSGFIAGVAAGAMAASRLGFDALWLASAAAVLFAMVSRKDGLLGHAE